MAKSDASLFGVPLKWISLILMVSQMVGMVFILRVSRTEQVEGPRYLNTTAIFVSEVLKFFASFLLHWWSSQDTAECVRELWAQTGAKPFEMLKTGVPSLLYTTQNNLLFIGLSHLSAGTYQVTYQFKILTTAGLSVLILGTKLNVDKWFALVVLTAGVVLVNTSGGQHQTGPADETDASTLLGLSAVGAACVTSGLAGVYLEKILKNSGASLWVKNMQLASIGALFALVIAYRSDGDLIRKDGFLQGYTRLVWGVVVCQALGGLLVAAVMKYADNILKCFGCAIAIIFTCILSVVVLHEFTPDLRFVLGTLLVLIATAIYSLGMPWSLDTLPGIRLIRSMEKKMSKSECMEV